MEPAFVDRKHKAAPRANRTGIPGGMKQDFETRSGLSFDDVRVHYNSQKPAKLGALAYTRGTQVYLGPGQERHLPHELGHVVQQKRGLVRPTGTVGGLPVNTDAGLEAQADHILHRKPAPPGVPGRVVQCYDDESVAKVYRLCHDVHRYSEITMEMAETFCQLLDQGINVPIPHRRAIIKYYPKPSNPYDYRIYAYYPQGAGDMGRCAAEGGATAVITSGLSYEPVAAFTDSRAFTQGTFANVPTRPSLNTIMGGSARVVSQVNDAEYLHMIAHSLGGPDDASNLMPGYHALNTAMIPFEAFVKNTAAVRPVVYRVDFMPHPGPGSLWVNTAQIQICVSVGDGTYTGSWTITIPENERLSKASYQEIKGIVNDFKQECGI